MNFEAEKKLLYLTIINQRMMKLSELLKLKRQNSIESAIDSIRPPIFWKDKPHFINQAKKWDLNKIKKVLGITYKLELKIKADSSINHILLIKNLMVNICLLANS